MDLTLQIHWDNEWHDAGTVRFHKEGQGLLGAPDFSYSAGYAFNALERHANLDAQDLIDKTAVGVNLPCHFGGDYLNGEIAPVLRDIIPQGAGRRFWVKMLGYDRDPEQALDTRLLAEGCIAPIGNLRIKEAAAVFDEKLAATDVVLFTEDEICTRADNLIEHAQKLGIAIGGATGAGGDAPKLLLVENHEGKFAFEGTIPEADIREHWLVKFPRGRKTNDDIDVLKGEAAIYKTLEKRGVDSIRNALLTDQNGRFALWLPRFDREVKQGVVIRHGMESIYSVMGRIGNGSALNHVDIIRRLQTTTTQPADKDALLVDYLIRDILNTTVGNRDNHGRNTAIIKRDRDIELAPAYDVAPMVLDPEAIARTTRWPDDLCAQVNDPFYPGIINLLGNDVEGVLEILAGNLELLINIRDDLIQNGAPTSMMEHPGVRLDYPASILDELGAPNRQSPAPR